MCPVAPGVPVVETAVRPVHWRKILDRSADGCKIRYQPQKLELELVR